jgi:hypothetical protein
MTTALTTEQFWQQLANFERTAFRLELQPAYFVGYEREQFDKFLAGDPEPPTEQEGLRAWFEQIRRQVADGKRIERVRIVDEPPTDYQRWTRYVDKWNIDAGEVVHYLGRRRAHEIGLLPAAGKDDFWLFDDVRLMTMVFNEQGRRISSELITEGERVQQARRLQHLAVRSAREGNG